MPTFSLPPKLVIETHKITGYLLNRYHPLGASKARDFLGRGFDPRDPAGFARALFEHARPIRFEAETDDTSGRTICFRGRLLCPSGMTSRDVRTIWQVPHEADHGRLVTAYPCG